MNLNPWGSFWVKQTFCFSHQTKHLIDLHKTPQKGRADPQDGGGRASLATVGPLPDGPGVTMACGSPAPTFCWAAWLRGTQLWERALPEAQRFGHPASTLPFLPLRATCSEHSLVTKNKRTLLLHDPKRQTTRELYFFLPSHKSNNPFPQMAAQGEPQQPCLLCTKASEAMPAGMQKEEPGRWPVQWCRAARLPLVGHLVLLLWQEKSLWQAGDRGCPWQGNLSRMQPCPL